MAGIIKMHNRITVFLLTFSVLTALMLPISAALPTAQDGELYSNVIRLHVIANSDSEYDQALKLKVRDEITETVAELLTDVHSKEEAEAILADSMSQIQSAAANVLIQNGSDYTVTARLTEEYYPTRRYAAMALPAGRYTSLQIRIGEAVGKNWWCVVFPTLCTGAVVDESELVAAGLTPSQVRIITGDSPEVRIKFRILEFIGEIFS